MNFLEVDGKLDLRIVPEVLAIKEFKDLASCTDNKEQRIKYFCAVAFFVMPNSPYAKFDDAGKVSRIQSELEVSFVPEIFKAVAKYRELFFDYNVHALRVAKDTARKTWDYFEQLDYSLTDKSGRPIYKPKEVNDALKQVPSVLQALEDAEARVKVGFKATGIKTRGDRVVTKAEIPTAINKEVL